MIKNRKMAEKGGLELLCVFPVHIGDKVKREDLKDEHQTDSISLCFKWFNSLQKKQCQHLMSYEQPGVYGVQLFFFSIEIVRLVGHKNEMSCQKTCFISILHILVFCILLNHTISAYQSSWSFKVVFLPFFK